MTRTLERIHNTRSMLKVAAGAGGKLAVLELLAKRRSDGSELLAIPMHRLGGDPIYVRPGTSDAYNATWYYLDALYRPPPGLEGPVETICEIGSNIGAALTALGHEHPGATLLGVEPDPGNCGVLRENAQRFGSRCKIVQMGVWDSDGELVIDEGSAHGEHGFTTRQATAGDEDKTRIKVTTLDALLDEHLPGAEVDYLHVSVEGAEPMAFSAPGWPERVRSLKIELHPYADFGFEECARQLAAKGYRVERDARFPTKWVNALRR